MIDYINWGMISILAGLGLGYWLRGQTMTTLEADVASLKASVFGGKSTVVTPVPVVVSAAPVSA
jgi:hypothetical protein